MVLEDVADRAGPFVVLGATPDAHGLGHRDLDVVDELPVPDRFEDPVREPQGHHVLDRFLAEVVIDSEDLVLGEVRLEHLLQLVGRREIVAERLLDDQSHPALRRAALADRLDDRLEDGGRSREVVDAVAPRLALLVELGQRRGEVVLALLVGEVHRDVVHAFGKRLPDVVTERIARVLLHRSLHPFPELVVRLFRARDADDCEVLGQQAAVGERVERGEELAFRQVAGRAEDDEDAGVRRPPDLQPFEQRVVLERGVSST